MTSICNAPARVPAITADLSDGKSAAARALAEVLTIAEGTREQNELNNLIAANDALVSSATRMICSDVP